MSSSSSATADAESAAAREMSSTAIWRLQVLRAENGTTDEADDQKVASEAESRNVGAGFRAAAAFLRAAGQEVPSAPASASASSSARRASSPATAAAAAASSEQRRHERGVERGSAQRRGSGNAGRGARETEGPAPSSGRRNSRQGGGGGGPSPAPGAGSARRTASAQASPRRPLGPPAPPPLPSRPAQPPAAHSGSGSLPLPLPCESLRRSAQDLLQRRPHSHDVPVPVVSASAPSLAAAGRARSVEAFSASSAAAAAAAVAAGLPPRAVASVDFERVGLRDRADLLRERGASAAAAAVAVGLGAPAGGVGAFHPGAGVRGGQPRTTSGAMSARKARMRVMDNVYGSLRAERPLAKVHSLPSLASGRPPQLAAREAQAVLRGSPQRLLALR
eukprot:TRINITY_DN5125_c0_g1_i2.p1 TRINITY_DN5125_c0_g1~~TRINITY_DN5125_c0_g1_i2.p1  ORF type:complete len:392 (+),score=94.36 TRINITY_DN5125_c0_g1_i2:3216-4391(+)